MFKKQTLRNGANIKMKFTIEKKVLAEALSNIQRAVSSKTTLPSLEGILVIAKNNVITLTAFDLELAMQVNLIAQVDEEGSTVLNAKLFLEIVRKLPSNDAFISVNDKHMATIEGGHSNFNIIGIDPEEFPDLPEISDMTQISLDGEILKSMIRQTIFAVSENDTKPIHQGSLFYIEDKVFDMVSIDGFRLAVRTEKVDCDENVSFVVPGKTLAEIIRLCEDDNVEIFSSRRLIMFKIRNYTILSPVLEGEFFDYKAAIPKDYATKVVVNTRSFIESVERVSLLISEKLKSPVKCVFNDNKINLLCTTAMGRATDELECEIDGGAIEIGFNNKYLLDALKNSECDEVELLLNGPLSSMVVKPKEGQDFTFLVLPLRL